MLAKKKEDNSLSRFDMNKIIPSLYEEYKFLKEVDSCSLRCAVFDLMNGFEKFYKKQGSFPKFKKKGVKTSYRTNNITSTYKGKIYESIRVDLKERTITLPKLKEIKIRGYRNLEKINGRIINATIKKEAKRYYVLVCVSEKRELPIKKEINAVGIDLGVKTLVTTSDGEEYGNPRYLDKYESRIQRLQKNLSRKKKGSNNYYKTKLKLEEVYRKLKNSRRKTAEEIVSKIIKYNDIIVMEKLKIKEMLEKSKKKLRKEINNATLNEIINKMKNKCKWLNKTFLTVDTYYASSQICSVCGRIDKSMKDLKKREYKCNKCGNVIKRDINASINIMIEGIFSYFKSKIETA